MLNWNRYFWTILGIMALGISVAASADLELDQIQVTGKVSFEHRQTIVPFVVCEGKAKCPKSEDYWVVSVKQDGNVYELSQRFAVGSALMPAEIQISDTILKNGALVRLEGVARPLIGKWFQLTSVNDVRVLEEPEEDLLRSPAWRCQSGDSDSLPRLHVEVWTPAKSPTDSSMIRVFGLNERGGYDLIMALTPIQIQENRQADQVVFVGSSSADEIRLTISAEDGTIYQSAQGVLDFKHKTGGLIAPFPLEVIETMHCSASLYP